MVIFHKSLSYWNLRVIKIKSKLDVIQGNNNNKLKFIKFCFSITVIDISYINFVSIICLVLSNSFFLIFLNFIIVHLEPKSIRG